MRMSFVDKQIGTGISENTTENSNVVKFFRGKSILITGSTGILGKLLVEKLLRSCADINKIYLIIRTKCNKNAEERLQELLENDTILQTINPECRKKLIPINGDISSPNFGISTRILEALQNEVNVIFNVALKMKLEEKLRISSPINVQSAENLMKFAKNCANLTSTVHLSSAYSNSHLEEIEEKVYDTVYNASQMRQLVEKYGKNLDTRDKIFSKGYVNSLSFTCAVRERTIRDHSKGLPVCIFRTTTLIPTRREPLKMYIENGSTFAETLTSPFGGVYRNFDEGKEVPVDFVPADYVVNGLILAAYENSLNDGSLKVYNCVSSKENPITFKNFCDLSKQYQNERSKKSNYFSDLQRKYLAYIFTPFFINLIQWTVFGLHVILTGKKPRSIALARFSEGNLHWLKNKYNFNNNNTTSLYGNLNETDKRIFDMNMSQSNFQWNEYLMQDLYEGIDTFVFKKNKLDGIKKTA